MNKDDLSDEYLEVLYREFFTPLFRYFYFRIKDYDQAIDLTQTTFLKFYSNDYEKNTKIHNVKILFTIARNTLIDYYRVSSKKQDISLDESNLEPVSEAPSPIDDFESNENIRMVKEALKILDNREEEVVMLRISTELDYDHIGEIMNENTVNVRQIYSRALKKIKAYLENKNIYE